MHECLTAQGRVGLRHSGGVFELEVVELPRCRGCESTCIWRWTKSSSLRVRSSLNLRPGDLVTISMGRRHFMQAVLLLHGLPWGGLLVGAAAGALSLGGDSGALLGALSGLTVGSIAARWVQGQWRFAPVLTELRES